LKILKTYEEEEEEEEEYFIDQLRTHKGHSNYNDWQYGIQTYNVHNNKQGNPSRWSAV
jgi:hypothetical protein